MVELIVYMSEDNKEIQSNTGLKRKGVIHYILSGGYILFLVAFLLGISFSLIFPNKILDTPYVKYIGYFFIIIGPILIYWAQSTSKALSKNPPLIPTFRNGPYKYIRTPTYSGILIMMFGYSLIIQSIYTFIFLIIAVILSKHFILKKQDKILSDRYGEHFDKYKKEVKHLI